MLRQLSLFLNIGFRSYLSSFMFVISESWLMTQEARSYADENGLLFMETSAKTAVNVNEIFVEIGEVFSISFIW